MQARKPSFRIPPCLFLLMLAGTLLGIIWLKPEYLTRSIHHPEFVISEIQAGNVSTLFDSDGDDSDWIEIHNPHKEAGSLAGYYLTDDFRDLTKWRIPAIELEGGGVLIIFASGKDRHQFSDDLHTNFRLDSRGEYLALVEPKGLKIVHEFLPKYPPMASDDSFGLREGYFDFPNLRLPKSHLQTAFYDHPSPGKPNRGEVWGQVADVHFSEGGGFFEKAFKLTIRTKTPNTIIHYTIDGSEPDSENGLIYDQAIEISQSTILRARAFREHYKASKISTRSFLFESSLFSKNESNHENHTELHTENHTELYDSQNEIKPALRAIPSLSLTLLPSAFFDLKNLKNMISSNENASSKSWESPAFFECFFPEKSKATSLNCRFHIEKTWRDDLGKLMHSFQISFQKSLGDLPLRSEIFGKGHIGSFKNLLLHTRKKGDLNSKFNSQMMSKTRPVHLFFNGSYWGIYTLLERDNLESSKISTIQNAPLH